MLMAVIFAILYGLSIGTPLLINPALTAECFGLANFGAIFGVLSLFNILGAGIGASLTGLIYDKAGSYFPAFWLYIFLLAVAVFCGVSARKIEK
jgi:MFS family permease